MLHVATKFNNEAREILVLRWEKLEKEKLLNIPNFTNPAEAARAWTEQFERISLKRLKQSIWRKRYRK